MKQIDRLMIKSFLPPFVVTFFIAMFVLLMQTLWVYIEKIAGKGLGFFLILELLAYKCVVLVPMALPLAILISSVMVLGNMGERYELSSLKSAGVPLLRIMRPLVFIGLLSMGLSYYCNNYLIPVANLQFGSRMFDIKEQKMALNLEEGVFNDDFDGYAIQIRKRERDERTVKGVKIYDHKNASQGRLSIISAEGGEMYAINQGDFFVINLKNGHQYVEPKPSGVGRNRTYPFVRTNFKSWEKFFDMSEFSLNRTNQDLFKQNRSMLSIDQLADAVDTIELQIHRREVSLSNQLSNHYYFQEKDSTFLDRRQAGQDSIKILRLKDTLSLDSLIKSPVVAKPSEKKKKARPNARPKSRNNKALKQKGLDQLDTLSSIAFTFQDHQRASLFSKARSSMRSIISQSEAGDRSLDRMRENRVKHIYDLHTKYSTAVVCLIFVFIGAPMGAIVRKGGFGYPILISILFFILFVVLTIFCRKIAESFVLPAALTAWLPSLVLFPIGVLLTSMAMRDSKAMNLDSIKQFFRRLWLKIRPAKTPAAE